ncbi:hypothetical protein VUR80DRAFT_5412 [Thermomyces stellatus]
MPSQTDYVRDLKDAHLDKLTYMLALPPQFGTSRPSRKWLLTQAETIPALPKTVLRPSKLIPRLAVKITEACTTPALPPAAVLCSTHRNLHPWLVRALFNLLAAEVTMRCDRLRKYEPEEGDDRGAEAKIVMAILVSVNALWLEDEHFKMLFGERAGAWAAKLHRVEGGCEACILAAVGARGELLAALRANMVARAHGSDPRLLRVVESWIRWFGGEQARSLLAESDKMAKAVRRARRAVRTLRRKERGVCPHGCKFGDEGEHRNSGWRTPSGQRTPGSPGSSRGSPRGSPGSQRESVCSPGESGEANGSPVREEIADWYARSELELGSKVPTRSIHPAFQPSSYEAAEGGGKRAEPEAPSTHEGYTSVLDSYGNTDAGTSSGRKTSWATCTVHTSQPAGHNPPPPDVPIPQLPAQGAYDLADDSGSEDAPICASSSIYSGTGTVWPQMPGPDASASKWQSERDPGTIFRDPFVGGGEAGARRVSSHVSPSAVAPAGWI